MYCEDFGNLNGCGTPLMLWCDMNSGHTTKTAAICKKHIIVPVSNVGFIAVLGTFLDGEQYFNILP